MMESYGELLRRTREAKNVSIETIENETAINKGYIESLENERVDDFPGESYFTGFLVNYCEYLGLDQNEVLRLYHAKKIQEAPIPPELLQKRKPVFLIPLLIILAVLLLGGGGAYLYFFVFDVPTMIAERAVEQTEKDKTHRYVFDGKPQTRRVYRGDQILIPAKEGEGNIVLIVERTLEHFAIQTPSGSQIIELSEERDIDVDADGTPELIIYLSDVSDTNEDNGAEIRILEKPEDSYHLASGSVSSSAAGTNMEDIPAASTVKNNATRTVVHEDTRAYPFTLTITFRAPCLFRYKSDRKDYVESYYKNGDAINITSSNGTRLWMSNLNALKIHVIAGLSSYDLEIGKAGEVQAEDIKWVRDSDGKYRLVVLELD